MSANKWGVWCVRSAASRIGPGEAWLKDGGKIEEYDTKEKAEVRADSVQQAVLSFNLSYYAKEIT